MILEILASIVVLSIIYFTVCYNHSDRKTSLRKWVIATIIAIPSLFILWM